MIPTLTFGFDYFEETELYNKIFQFDKIELFINIFSIRYSAEYIPISEHQRQFLDRESEPEVFDRVWNLIKSKSYTEDFPDMEPKIFYTLPIKNTPYIEIGEAEVHYIPVHVSLLIGYCDTSEWAEIGLCKDFGTVGLISDIERLMDEEKDEIRNAINLLVGIIAIVIGLMLFKIKKNVSVLRFHDKK